MVYTYRKYLYADNEKELLAFADRIQLHYSQFIQHDRFPHYSLDDQTQRRALYYGAQLVSARDLIEIFQVTAPMQIITTPYKQATARRNVGNKFRKIRNRG